MPSIESLETAFSCIQSGNELESQDRNWEAASQFLRAHQILNNLPADNNDEKLAALYQQQARDYLIRSRQVLMAAMKQENDQDAQDAKSPPVFRSIMSDGELENRTTLFASLFSRLPTLTVSTKTIEGANSDSGNALSEKSLEERLMQLNENLPQGFKTSEQRMADINRGLNRLGLSLYSHSDTRPLVDPPKSESQQVEDIIAQARDEVRLIGVDGGGGGNIESSLLSAVAGQLVASPETPEYGGMNGEQFDFAESDLESNNEVKSSAHSDGGSDDVHSSDEIELTPQQIVSIRDQVTDAQAELAQLLVLLEMDEGGDAEIEFEQRAGLVNLFKARKSLQRAAIEWKKNPSSQ